MRLVIIEDKNTGHNRPLNALVNELSKLQESEIIQFRLNDDVSGFSDNLKKSAFSKTLILGAGHRSHKKIIALQKCIAKKENAIGVALMKPTFCINQYDLVVAPNHDFLNRKIPKNVITHSGSLSKVSHAHVIENTLLIAIGGPNPKMPFQENLVLNNINHVLNVHPDYKIRLCNSRRTPNNFWNKIKGLDHEFLEIYEENNTDSAAFQNLIATSEKKFVTPDSINLVSECLSSMGASYVVQINKKTQKKSILPFKQNKFLKYIESMRANGQLGYVAESFEGPFKLTRIEKPRIINSPMCEVEKVAFQIKNWVKNKYS
jgi:mitochondrial fission protein ELM1